MHWNERIKTPFSHALRIHMQSSILCHCAVLYSYVALMVLTLGMKNSTVYSLHFTNMWVITTRLDSEFPSSLLSLVDWLLCQFCCFQVSLLLPGSPWKLSPRLSSVCACVPTLSPSPRSSRECLSVMLDASVASQPHIIAPLKDLC